MCYLQPAPNKKGPERENVRLLDRQLFEVGLPTLMARVSTGFKLLGCAITIVLTESVEPRRPATAPPKQYLAINTLA